MANLEDLQQRQALLQQLAGQVTPDATQQAEQLREVYHDREMAGLAADVYQAAKGEGEPPAGWMRASEHPDLLKEYARQSGMTDKQLMNMLQPENSGFRAEIYLPDPSVLGPGYKPTLVFKGSSGEVKMPDGTLRDTTGEDFAANNFPQSVGLETDYYDRAMRLALKLKGGGIDFEIAGHSLGGGLASAAAAVTGARATTLNAAGLHPATAQRFAEQNPGVRVYDTQRIVTAYQVSGELLNNGIQENVHRLDAVQRRQLGEVMRETCELLNEVPEGRAMLKRTLDAAVPPQAQGAVHAFVDRLAEGDTEKLLEELPLAAGRVQPLLVAKTVDADGNVVARRSPPSLQEVSELAGPALSVLHAATRGAHAGHRVGEAVAAAGRLAERGLDGSGDLARGASGHAANLARDATHAVGTTMAEARSAFGDAQSDAARLRGELQARGAALGARLLRGTEQLLPEALQGTLGGQAERLERAGAEAQRQATQEAAQSQRAARADVATIRASSALLGGLQHVGITEAGRQLDRGLDAAGKALSFAADRAPGAMAAQSAASAGTVAAAQELVGPVGNWNAAKTAALAGTVIPSGSEAMERHLNGTILPSMDSRVAEREAAARQHLAAPAQHPPPPKASDPSQPGHPDHALQQQIKSGVERLNAQLGRGWDESSDRLTASLLVLAKREGLTRVDHVGLNAPTATLQAGQTAFVVQGDSKDPAHLRAAMPTEQALQTPQAQSFAQLESVNRDLAQARAQQAQNEALAQQRAPAPALG
jgi:hypothetical protein